ncbi:hypothetical protein [Oricola cellulosilytica]|uniref:Uncharacterized protein n=1 Tax=Oricola cellulosilytica TaxID=1429082 RepID=A0A4R0PB17_9HYPH|nr:hypothetical protein [Oricola cellulosilytica]TCD14236.1 hypothetical protein E0D97_09145 [Oricola cellulosilytica]
MDWEGAIAQNRADLERIVAALFALAGLIGMKTVATLPRSVHDQILLVLRPAESAVRRLIVTAARHVLFQPRKGEAEAGPPVSQAEIIAQARLARERGRLMEAQATRIVYHRINLGLATFAPPGARQQRREAEALKGGAKDSMPAFQLFDPLKRFDFSPARGGPRGVPRIVNFFDGDPQPVPVRPAPTPDDPVSAVQLCRRLLALKAALDDIPGEARRLARWKARHDHARDNGRPVRPRRIDPLRSGWPPGHRKRHVHDIDEVLVECNWLAHYAREKTAAPDTS